MNQCPYCKGAARPFLVAKDWNRSVTNESFDYLRCDDCRLIFIAAAPADLGRYYQASYYGPTGSLADLESEFARERYKIEMVRQFVSSGRLLEVGPSRGAFAYLAREAGFDVTVIERDPECCRLLADVIKVDVINDARPERRLLALRAFDVIALWQVIEHLEDPWSLLRATASRLRPGGILVVATPNPSSLQFRIFGRYWAHLDAPRHLQLIPASTLCRAASEHGLDALLVTAADADVRRHNVFGWQWSLRHAFPKLHRSRLLGYVAAYLPPIVSHLETKNFRATSYTVVLQKRWERSAA